jgi:hypothetical protein
MVAEPACIAWDRRIVRLRRERWDQLSTASGLHRVGGPWLGEIVVTLPAIFAAPDPADSIIFLPATYVCEDGDDTNAGTATR